MTTSTPKRSVATRWPTVLAAGFVLALSGLPCDGPAYGESGPRRRPAPSTTVGAPLLRIADQARTGSQPKSVYVSPDGSRVYVCNFGRPNQDNIRVHNATSLDLIGTIEFEGNCVELAFSPDGNTIYASNFRRNMMEVIDAGSLTVRAEVDVGHSPKTIVVSDDGNTIYVANDFDSSVTVVNARRLAVTGTIRTGHVPRGMAVGDNGRLYVASFNEHFIQEFDTRDRNREVRRIRTCRYPRSIALSNDESRLYVSCSCCRALAWYDLSSGSREGYARVGHNPRTIDMSTDGRFIAVADFDSSTVSLVDTVGMTHRINYVRGSDQIVGIAIRPGPGLRIYATSWNNNRLFTLVPAR